MAQNIFTSQTPALPNLTDEPISYSLGTRFTSAVDGYVTGLRFYAATGAYPASSPPGTNLILGLFEDDTQTELGRVSMLSTAVVLGAWNELTLATPIAITAGVEYMAVYRTPTRYVATTGFFSSPLTNGDLTATSGAFKDSVGPVDLTYPTTDSTASYFADVVFEAGDNIAPDGISVPVTLGQPTVDGGQAVAPDGITVPVTLGQPMVSGDATVAPDGITIPVSLGEPTLTESGDGSVAPDGITIPVTLGTPTVTQVIPPSPLGVDLALQAASFVKACLCSAVALLESPPTHCRFQVGTEGFAGIDLVADECCEGVAYVAMGDMYPSWDNFPDAEIVRQADDRCSLKAWAVDFKLGIIRCGPLGTDYSSPSDTEWNTKALLNIADAQALRRATCCIRSGISSITGYEPQFDGMSVVIGRQTTPTPQGGCMERNVMVTVQFMACEVC